MVELLRLTPPARVLDVGCGLGDEAVQLAALAGVQVVAVDGSRVMIEEATRRAEGSGLPLTFQVADAAALPLATGSFDAGHALTLLEHIGEPAAVVAELTRVIRPGGRLALVDLDQGSTFVDHPDRATTRTILNGWTDGFSGGWNGRALRRLLLQAGADDVTFELVTSEFDAGFMSYLLTPTTRRLVRDGELSAADAEHWWAGLREFAADGRFTAAATWCLAAGTVGAGGTVGSGGT